MVETVSAKPQLPGTKEVQLPLANGVWPVLRGQFPMSSGDWDQMIALLQAMKPGLVRSET